VVCKIKLDGFTMSQVEITRPVVGGALCAHVVAGPEREKNCKKRLFISVSEKTSVRTINLRVNLNIFPRTEHAGIPRIHPTIQQVLKFVDSLMFGGKESSWSAVVYHLFNPVSFDAIQHTDLTFRPT